MVNSADILAQADQALRHRTGTVNLAFTTKLDDRSPIHDNYATMRW
jgi:hypothetical protein